MKSLKRLLLLQSLSPIAFLMFIKEYPFELIGQKNITDIFQENILSTILLILLALWLFGAWVSRHYLTSFYKIESEEKNQTIKITEEDKESSSEFFMTFLLPLVVDDVDKINGFCMFWIIIIMVAFLLSKTTLFYRNPVLTALGYKMYWLDQNGKKILGISSKKIEPGDFSIKYTPLSDDVFFFKKA